MPTLTVNVGKRPYGEFQRVVKTLKEFGFRFSKTDNTWSRFIDHLFAPDVIQQLRELGIRARIDEKLSSS